ncbi:HIT family protein [Nocardia salmonicida]|uniref:HIT family protein n=1 Tax=Nocardia salmonicida TaxID=53431 RepID=UPI0033C40DEC
MPTDPECLICAKHRGHGALVGPVVYADEVVVVTHRVLGAGVGVVPGYLFVEPRRHVGNLAHLTWEEAQALARAVWCGARALDAELAPRHVFSMIAGRSVAHVHQHLFVRPRSMPEEFAWHDVDSWTGGERLDAEGLALLCSKLSRWFGES